MPYNILILGAAYGSLLGSKILFGGHYVNHVCLPAEADLINSEGFRVRLPVRGRPRPPSRVHVTPYLGASALLVSFKQVSRFADASENPSNTFKGAGVFGGAEFGVWKRVLVGGEAQYRVVPNALGKGGVSDVSAAYDEKDLGGFTLRVTIGYKVGGR